MPNWCENNVVFKHENPAMIAKVVKGMRETGLFMEFFPPPPDMDYDKDWYEWNQSNWGVKWDVCDEDGISSPYTEGDTEVSIFFDSAWNPPIIFYNNLIDQGFQIEAYYFEEGMQICGKYHNGNDAFYDIEHIDGKYIPWIEANIPEDIIEEFDLYSRFEYLDDDSI